MPSYLAGPDEEAFHLGLTPAQLKVTHTALHLLLDDFGHDERDVVLIVREVLDKLPSDLDMRSHILSAEFARRQPAAPTEPVDIV